MAIKQAQESLRKQGKLTAEMEIMSDAVIFNVEENEKKRKEGAEIMCKLQEELSEFKQETKEELAVIKTTLVNIETAVNKKKYIEYLADNKGLQIMTTIISVVALIGFFSVIGGYSPQEWKGIAKADVTSNN